MKILFLARLFYPHIGGVEKHVLEISRRLVDKGHEVTIITEELPDDHRMRKQYNEVTAKLTGKLQGIEVVRIPVGGEDWFKKIRIWRWMWKNREFIMSKDIIHCHDVFFWYLPLSLIYPLKDVYTTFHGYENYPISLKSVFYRKIFEKLSNKSICVGDFMKKWYKASPNTVIYGGTDIYTSTQRLQDHSAVFVGRLDEQTGIEMYASALKRIRDEVNDFTLSVIGDGPYKDKLSKEGIIQKGWQLSPEKELGKYRFAFISRYLAILEAFAAKRLVFAVYDNPVKEDYLKMTPYHKWIVIAGSSEELTEKVLYYINHPQEEKQVVDAAYEWVKKNSWDDIVEVYTTLWKK